MADDEKTYCIDGREFRLERLTFRQEEWLREHVLGDLDVIEMGEPEWRELLRFKIHLFLAIAFIEKGQTRKEKASAGYGAVLELAEFLAVAADPEALWKVVPDFFVVNPPVNLWMLVDYRRAAADRAPSISTSSEKNSVSLPTETLRSAM